MRIVKRIDNKKTARLLKEALRQRGARQAALSKALGVHQSQISRLLGGHFQRRSKTLHALCKKLHVRPVYRNGSISLPNYPDLAICLSEVLDGSRKREKAVVQLLKSARGLS